LYRHTDKRTPALGSLTAAWVIYCTMNFTGPTSTTKRFSSWQWQYTRRQLCSANQLLAVPCYWFNTYSHQAFSVASPKVCNSLPDFIRDPTISADCFRRLLKTYLFARYYWIQHVRGSWRWPRSI